MDLLPWQQMGSAGPDFSVLMFIFYATSSGKYDMNMGNLELTGVTNVFCTTAAVQDMEMNMG